eukprot:jgi/Chlat1/7735/Chrsp66S07209
MGVVVNTSEQNAYQVTLDMKSGYHHIPIAKPERRFLGVAFDGHYFKWNVLPFGLNQACFVFTAVQSVVHRPLREAGIGTVAYIDDMHMAHTDHAHLRWRLQLVWKLFAALSWFFGLPKCILDPVQQLQFLGLVINTVNTTFAIPQHKLQALHQLLQALQERDCLTNREFASLAGKRMAYKIAVPPESLFANTLMQAVQLADGWDHQSTVSDDLRAFAIWLQSALPRYNGHAWWPPPTSLLPSADASGTRGWGASTPWGPLLGNFDTTELALPSAIKMASAYIRVLSEATRTAPQLAHTTVGICD